MLTPTLTAAGLAGWANEVRISQLLLEDQATTAAEADGTLSTHGSGDALVALGGVLGDNWAGLMRVLEDMRTAAEVLARAAGLQAQLEAALERIRRVADTLPALEFVAGVVQLFGARLDARCAAEISALCQELPPPPTNYLAEYPELPVAAVHAAVLLDHPEYEALAAEHPDIRFIAAGDGLIAGVAGDLDSAESVTTVVSGVGSSNPESWGGAFQRARDVSAATGGAAVAWLGYQAPSMEPAAVGSRHARRGGEQLREFQDALAARRPAQRRIVVGHSYGSTVSGWAAANPQHPLQADHVVLLGSPGVPQSSAEEFQLSGRGEVHAGTYLGDAVGHVTGSGYGVHGSDPSAHGFGARPLDGSHRFLGHSDYWRDPAFLSRLREISQGMEAR